MRVDQLGSGTPQVAVVAGVHGDEPGPVRAVERLREERPDVCRPVKLIVANEAALERNVRYVDEDLNRVFPGSPDAGSHERRLAHHLRREIRDCTVLSLHETQSHPEPFALTDCVDAVARGVCPSLPISVLVETDGHSEGRLISEPHTLEVECGLQGSEAAAENAYRIIDDFLAATCAFESAVGEPVDAEPTREVVVYRLRRPLTKDEADRYEVCVENFERVASGRTYAAADDVALTAEEDFYPVLLSAYGYEDIFGYTADRVGVLGE